jgi:hypothetical protein
LRTTRGLVHHRRARESADLFQAKLNAYSAILYLQVTPTQDFAAVQGHLAVTSSLKTIFWRFWPYKKEFQGQRLSAALSIFCLQSIEAHGFSRDFALSV